MSSLCEILVDTPGALDACCHNVATSLIVGLDTEFVGEHSYHPELCLIQVATDSTLYLIDPFAFDSLDAFWGLVVDPSRTIVVHAGREEVRLCHLACGQTPSRLVDLQIAAGLVGYPYPLGHGPLIQQVLGKKIKKGETLTEWRTRPLAAAQVRYAFDDVRYLLPVWAKLDKQLHAMDRHEWAREEFARLRALATPEPPSVETVGEKWRKLRGIGSLDRRKLAFVRALFGWRESKAHEWNRPSRVIVRDDLLLEIARRTPKSPGDFGMIRGLAHKFLDEIFALYEHVQAIPLEECPVLTEKEQDAPQVNLAVTLLTAVLPDFAAKNQLAPSLITSNAEVRSLVRACYSGKPIDDGLNLTKGWRAAAVLPHLQAILDGRVGLRLADLKSESPLEYFEQT